MHDPQDDALQRAQEIYQRLMREMRMDLERKLQQSRTHLPAAAAPRGDAPFREPS